ncbi:hypothetical protein M422DRAFT_64157 [Sphaerobolus stellatus SS14]|nr:hypothetical protein M422DRAFT_64157 [Sphaerobolus stellatus SS14]
MCLIRTAKKTRPSVCQNLKVSAKPSFHCAYTDLRDFSRFIQERDADLSIAVDKDKELEGWCKIFHLPNGFHANYGRGSANEQEISSTFYSKNAYIPDFSTINLVRLFTKAGSLPEAGCSFGEITAPSLANLESPSFKTRKSFLPSLDDSPLLPRTPFRDEYCEQQHPY